jgi:hypothetical protein
MVTVELSMLKAAPEVCRRSLQLKTVEDAVPLITSDAKLLMLTVGSLKTPATRETFEALATCTAYATVLQGGSNPHASVSTPFCGSTVAEAIAAAAADGKTDAMHVHAKM